MRKPNIPQRKSHLFRKLTLGGIVGACSLSSAQAASVITLGDFTNATVEDFNSLASGVISPSDPVFTALGISNLTGSEVGDTFEARANSSNALGFTGGQLAVRATGESNLASVFTVSFTNLITKFGFGVHDQGGTMNINFFNGATMVDSNAELTPNGPDLNQYYFESASAFDSVTINVGSSGFALDNLTVENTSVVMFDPTSVSQAYRVQHITPKLATTTINGAHHRLLMDSALGEDGWHTWATGDYSDFNEVDATQTIGEIGASRNFGNDDFRFGVGVGHTVADQNAAFGGGSKIDGDFLVLETNHKVPDSNVIFSMLFYYGKYDVETERGYLLGGAKSLGNTDAISAALRLRADWKNAFVKDKFHFTPRFAYTFVDSSADAYTEVGGASPVSYDAQDSKDHEFRLGVDIDYAFNSKTQCRGIVEAVYRKNDNDNLRGSAGAVTFNLPGEDTSNLWGRLGVEVVHQFNDKTTLNASVFGSTEGYDATVSGSLGVNIKF